MTPQDLLADLRDIHLPPTPGTEVDSGVALLPWLLLLLVLGLLLAAALWRRGVWRRQARARLAALDDLGDARREWAALIALSVEVARHAGPAVVPEAVYRDPAKIGRAEVDGLKRRIAEALGR